MITYIIASYVIVILFHIHRGVKDAIDIMYVPITSTLAPVSLPVIVVTEIIEWLVIKRQ